MSPFLKALHRRWHVIWNSHTRWFNIVTNLMNHIIGTNRKVFFDNYFMSVPLLLSMLAQHLLGCGTICPHYIGYPKELSKLKKLKRRVQNYAEWLVNGYCMTTKGPHKSALPKKKLKPSVSDKILQGVSKMSESIKREEHWMKMVEKMHNDRMQKMDQIIACLKCIRENQHSSAPSPSSSLL